VRENTPSSSSLVFPVDAGQWPKLRKTGRGTTHGSLHVDVMTTGNRAESDGATRSRAALPLRLTLRDRSSKVTELVASLGVFVR
jgi:hypothetical protein